MVNDEQRRWLSLPFRRAFCCGAHLRYTALGARHNEHMPRRGASHSIKLEHGNSLTAPDTIRAINAHYSLADDIKFVNRLSRPHPGLEPATTASQVKC